MARWEALLGVLIVAAGATLRAWYLGAPSLWWDELVHIRTAQQANALEVARVAWHGIYPGTGNAGAVPVDYVLLHAWLRAVPHPAPERLEIYYRFPAFLAAAIAPAAVWLLGRRMLGTAAALIAAAALAGMPFHVLYATEARHYALLTLVTMLQLAVFARLAEAPAIRRWVAFGGASVLLVMTGLYGTLLVALECAAMAAIAAARWRRGERGPARALVAVGVVLAVVVGGYLLGAEVLANHGRPPIGRPPPLDAIPGTFATFAGAGLWMGWALLVAVPAAVVVVAIADRSRLVIVSVCAAAALVAIPAMIGVSHLKGYYFHPRHATWLVVPIALVVGTLVAGVLQPILRRPSRVALAGVALVAATLLPGVRAYLEAPYAFFIVSKREHHFAALVQMLVQRVAQLAPGDRLLLLVERNRPGHLGNPVLQFYLREYGIADRVVLRGYGDPRATLAAVQRECPAGCAGVVDAELDRRLGTGDPFDQLPQMRAFLELDGALPMPAPRIGATGVVVYAAMGPVPGFTTTAFRNVTLFEPSPGRASPPAPR